jgi:hypothetical protein
MPSKKVHRGVMSKQAKTIMSFTNSLWTILGDGSFWTIYMDEQGGYVVSRHGAVVSQASTSTKHRCPVTNECPLHVLVFDVSGYRNNSGESMAVRVLPGACEQIISWTSGDVSSCHQVVHELYDAKVKKSTLGKMKSKCQFSDSFHPSLVFVLLSCCPICDVANDARARLA